MTKWPVWLHVFSMIWDSMSWCTLVVVGISVAWWYLFQANESDLGRCVCITSLPISIIPTIVPYLSVYVPSIIHSLSLSHLYIRLSTVLNFMVVVWVNLWRLPLLSSMWQIQTSWCLSHIRWLKRYTCHWNHLYVFTITVIITHNTTFITTLIHSFPFSIILTRLLTYSLTPLFTPFYTDDQGGVDDPYAFALLARLQQDKSTTPIVLITHRTTGWSHHCCHHLTVPHLWLVSSGLTSHNTANIVTSL